MAIAYCRNEDCDKDPWELEKPPDEYSEGPRCSDCGSRNVEIDREDDLLAALEPTGGSRLDRLEEAVAGLPGVGENGVRHVTKLWENYETVREPESLRQALLRLKNVDEWAADLVVREVFEDEQKSGPPGGGSGAVREANADAAPRRPAPPRDGGADTLDALVKAREAGLLGSDDDGTDPEEVAQAVGETVNEAMSQIAQTQQQLARAIQSQDGGGEEIAELRDEIERLREEQREQEIDHLREKVEKLESRDTATSPEIEKLRTTAKLQQKALSEASETVDKLIDRGDDNLLMWLDKRFRVGEQIAEDLYQPPAQGAGFDYEPNSPAAQSRREAVERHEREAARGGQRSPEQSQPAATAETDGGGREDPKARDPNDAPHPPDEDAPEADGYAEEVAAKVLDNGGDADGGGD